MALEEVTISSTKMITEITEQLGQLGLWLQAIGILIILWIIFNIITLINNRIKRKQLYSIEKRLKGIEEKINILSRKL